METEILGNIDFSNRKLFVKEIKQNAFMTFDKGQSTQLVEKNYWMDKICPEPGVYYNVS